MANILVTGAAGYIGSHTCLALAQNGFTPVVFDNLVNGHRDFVQWGRSSKAMFEIEEANVGTGRGTSVKELVRVVEMISKKRLPIEFGA